ncbi:hypothetical protein GCK32_011047, partial [Trichostrongylus colubriformis]
FTSERTDHCRRTKHRHWRSNYGRYRSGNTCPYSNSSETRSIISCSTNAYDRRRHMATGTGTAVSQGWTFSFVCRF